jgi:small Trp-rich protein
MAFLIVGLLLAALKVAEFDPVAGWSWWTIAIPFGLAVLWWTFSDATGMTQRRAIRKMEEKKVERRRRDMESLGLTPSRDRGVQRALAAQRTAAANRSSMPTAAVKPTADARSRSFGDSAPSTLEERRDPQL